MTLAVPAPARARPNALWSFISAQPLGAVSLLFILGMVFASLFAIWIVPHDPLKLDFAEILAPPSRSYPFGTDNLGRCVFSRVVFGARTALVIGILASLVGSTIGGLIGVVQGYFGGRLDFYVSRFIDILLSFPIIVLALVVVAMLGKKIVLGVDMNLVVAIAIPIIPKVARVVRSASLSVREMPYVDAARASGFSHQRIVLRHMVPNVFAPFIIMFTAFVAQAILLEASLSFLGLGVTEPTPAWGLMLAGNAADFYREAPWMIIFPGLAISLSVFAFNLFGDALRDHLDPRFKV
ncbi:MAG: ABC transporter permease [Hyphomicrobiales bacterium]|nr:ABC transporter permease [Hyphomicrobiales bacterium]